MEFSLLLAFLIYFGALFVIGIISSYKTQSSDDFLIGSRSVNYWVTAIAAHASDMSAWLFMGFPAVIYMNGLINSWIAVGLLAGMLLSWHFVAHKLRTMTEKLNVITLSSFLEKRFNDTSGLLRLSSGTLTILFFIFYIAAGLTGMGFVFESVFEVNYLSGMFIGLIISIAYMLLGGFIAIAWNHFFQGVFLLVAIVVVPLYALYHLGSITPIITQASIKGISLSPIWPLTQTTMIMIINGITWGLGYIGMPHVIVNFMGINDPAHIKRAKYIGMIWLAISLTAAVSIGLVGIGYFPALENSELVFVELVKNLFNPLLTGFILCAILAATMSTIDTQILVASSAITQDLYKKTLHKTATERHIMLISRLSIMCIALISFLIAYEKNTTVMGFVSYAWSGLTSSFSPVILAALYSTYVNKWGALASIVGGGLVSALWPLMNSPILPLIPGVITSTVLLYSVSWFTIKRTL